MDPHLLKSCSPALAPAIATPLLVQACGGSHDANAQAASGADPVDGVWESTITICDCTSGAALRNFTGVNTLHRGGTLTDTHNTAPSTRGPGAGIWRAGMTLGSYTASIRFDRYNPDGTLAGTQRVNRNFMLAADGTSTTGTIAAQILDATDVVRQNVCGAETSVRLF
ncbi:MAG: hypothetical protein U5L03_01345 [Burkholderiaceae bacterium]|nr:hypothetical protein [Burkholderiaceae bacterium]